MRSYESPLMQTLNCSTDYESSTACTWFERQEARSLVNMTLFHSDTYLSLENMTCNSQKVGSLIQWECHRTQTLFNIWLKNIFIFKPQLSLEAQLNVSIFNNIQPLPPQKLVVSVTEDGDSLLIWEPGDGMNRSHWLNGALDFEVTYKRFWEPWEDASSLVVSNASHCLLRHDKLVSGNTYVARVRSKSGRESQLAGQYSDWSSVVTWDTPEDEVEAQPKNLRCRFNSINQLKCSWEVRQEVTSSVLFALFYKDNPASQEEECSPVHEKELPSSPLNSPHHVLQSCEISVTNPNGQSQYLVTVRPKEEKREVDAKMQIKTAPPYDLSVTVLNYHTYRLQWKDKVPLNFKQMYQISYWKTGNPLEAKYINAGIGEKEYTFTSEFLQPGLSYTAKVQAKVHEDGCDGPWSEWSKEFQWTTNNVFPPWVILLIGVIFIILLMAGLYFCYKYLLSKKRKWEASIPSPPRTLLLPGVFQKVALPDDPEDRNSQSYRKMLAIYPESPPAELRKTEQFPISSQTMEKVGLPTVSKAGQFLTQSAAEKKVISNHKIQIFDYDGPYLHCPPESSLPDISQDVQAPPTEKMKKHMGLPRCLCPQQLPMGKEKGAVPLFLAISDEWEEEKQQHLKRQEGSQRDKSGKEKSKEERPQHLPETNSLGQNGALDYIATENLSISKEEGSLLWIPALASEKRITDCTNMATGVPETTADLSSSKMGQKKPEIVLSSQGQIPTVPSAASQEAFDDYIMSLSVTPGSMLKEGLAFSSEDPKLNKGFLIFNPDNKSPVLLSQVGDYCFFPGFKPSKETPKNPVGTAEHNISQTGSKVTKPLDDSQPGRSKLQISFSPLPKCEV
ncbi:cytokine receptor common subunit beta isoform X2 [Sceloporus undulatus]|uniref:cytokine receptor common subunit beta isoform X2 n=1 Tax=Sceloporus undulatus TaxID=8520 RepID=UPI001C4D498A|nr:cytokine receptor common subunit beta isoform X2 [Sceloporus undulatus]